MIYLSVSGFRADKIADIQIIASDNKKLAVKFCKVIGANIININCEPFILSAGTYYNLKLKVNEKFLTSSSYEEHEMSKHIFYPNSPYSFEVFVKDKIRENEVIRTQENGYYELLEHIMNPCWRETNASEFFVALPILITKIVQLEFTKPILGHYLTKELSKRTSNDSPILIYILCHCLKKVPKVPLQLPYKDLHYHLLTCSQLNKNILFSELFNKFKEHGIALCQLLVEKVECIHIILYLYPILGMDAVKPLIKKSCSKMPSDKSDWCQIVLKYGLVGNPSLHKYILEHLIYYHCPGLEAIKTVFDNGIANKRPTKEQIHVYNEVFQHGILVKTDEKLLKDDPIAALHFCACYLPPEINNQNVLFVETVLFDCVNYLYENKNNSYDDFVKLCKNSAVLKSSDEKLTKLLTLLANSDHASLQKLFLLVLKGEKFCGLKLPVSLAKLCIQTVLQNFVIKEKERCGENLQTVLARLREIKKLKCFASNEEVESISNEAFDSFLNTSTLEYILMAIANIDISGDYLEIHILKLLSLRAEYVKENFTGLVNALTEAKSIKQQR